MFNTNRLLYCAFISLGQALPDQPNLHFHFYMGENRINDQNRMDDQNSINVQNRMDDQNRINGKNMMDGQNRINGQNRMNGQKQQQYVNGM